jgi:outer membrane protein OmpA-like peptidoglycan-associated protein
MSGGSQTPPVAGLRRTCRLALLLAGFIVGGGPASDPCSSLAAEAPAQAPTEEQILKALQQKRLTRCPQTSTGCGGAQEDSAGSAIHVEVTFDVGSTALGRKARSALAGLRDVLVHRGPDDGVLLVAGHADANGSDIYNQHLSERRAAAVKRFLTSRFNLRADTLKAIGFGKTRPKNAADPYADENRRVEIENVIGR